jgi:hypothetical protein
MVKLSGLVFVKHGRVGTRSEGPDYFLQTANDVLLLRYQPRMPFQPDYHLEFYGRRMVELEGEMLDKETVQVSSIQAINASAIPQVAPSLGAPFEVRRGETVRLSDAAMEVEFLMVESDSRCPTGAVCVWEGEVVIIARVAAVGSPGEKVRLTLRAGAPEMGSAEVLGYRVTVTDVQPHPVLGQDPPEQGAYVATMVLHALR